MANTTLPEHRKAILNFVGTIPEFTSARLRYHHGVMKADKVRSTVALGLMLGFMPPALADDPYAALPALAGDNERCSVHSGSA